MDDVHVQPAVDDLPVQPPRHDNQGEPGYSPDKIEADFEKFQNLQSSANRHLCTSLLHEIVVRNPQLLQHRQIIIESMEELRDTGLTLLVIETRRAVPHRIYLDPDIRDPSLKRALVGHEIVHLVLDKATLISHPSSESLMERQRANALGSILAARRGHVKARWKADPKMVGELAGIIGERGLPGDIVGAVVKFLLDTDDGAQKPDAPDDDQELDAPERE